MIDRREREREQDVRLLPPGGYDPPSRNELASIPWDGEGDDPLEDLYEQASYEAGAD